MFFKGLKVVFLWVSCFFCSRDFGAFLVLLRLRIIFNFEPCYLAPFGECKQNPASSRCVPCVPIVAFLAVGHMWGRHKPWLFPFGLHPFTGNTFSRFLKQILVF